jgi:hypothetical protein
MASIDITCPECKKQLKGPEELIGKKIRCKSCKATFTVKAPGKKGAAVSQGAKARDAESYAFEDEDGKNPYKMSDVVRSSRCPQCAADMEEGDIICLNCGYNTQTRIRHQTVKTYETTFADWILWLTPAVLAIVLILALIGGVVWLWVPAGMPRLADVGGANEAWWGHFSIRIYGSVIGAGICWWCGKFAFKRLVLHPTPPERVKR